MSLEVALYRVNGPVPVDELDLPTIDLHEVSTKLWSKQIRFFFSSHFENHYKWFGLKSQVLVGFEPPYVHFFFERLTPAQLAYLTFYLDIL